MSKALKTVAVIAGAVALVATGVGAAAGFLATRMMRIEASMRSPRCFHVWQKLIHDGWSSSEMSMRRGLSLLPCDLQ